MVVVDEGVLKIFRIGFNKVYPVACVLFSIGAQILMLIKYIYNSLNTKKNEKWGYQLKLGHYHRLEKMADPNSSC